MIWNRKKLTTSNDEQYSSRKNELTDKIAILKQKITETESRALNWLQYTEQVFNFAQVAKTKFEDPETTIDEKKSIFTALGWNYIVKDKKLYISANDWLEPIEKKKKSVEEEINRLELEKTFTLKGQNTRLGVLCPVLRAVVNEVRTAIMENKGYIYIPDLQNSTPH